MLKQLTIHNYKLFEKLSLKDIPPILLISGKNNTGKTTALEAVCLALDSANPAMFMKHFSWRSLDAVSNDGQTLFGLSYHNFDLSHPITLEYSLENKRKKISYKFVPSNQFINIKDNVKDKGNFEIQKEPLHTIAGAIEIIYGLQNPKKALLISHQKGIYLNPIQQQELIKYNEKMIGSFLHSSTAFSSMGIAQRYSEADKANQVTELLKMLQILEPKLKSLSLSFLGDKPTVYGNIDLEKKIPLALMGQGMCRLLAILLNIFHCKNGIALIDELENGFHYSVLPRVWELITKFAQTNNTQIIATTHSRELAMGAIEGIPAELRKDFQYIRLEKKDKLITPKVYTFELLKGALESQLEIR